MRLPSRMRAAMGLRGADNEIAAASRGAHGLSPKPGVPRQMNDALDAAVFRRLLAHLDARKDVQNIDLMIAAGFCRNCLADWYREAAEARGIEMDKDAARERIYGMPFAQWKAQFQPEATPGQLEAFANAQKKHG